MPIPISPDVKPLSPVLASFDDLAPAQIRVEIDHAGQTLIVPMRALTYFEWEREGAAVPVPVAPIHGVDKQGRPIQDMTNPEYLRQVADANTTRSMRRLLAALLLPIPGETVEARLAALREKLDYNLARQLLGVLVQQALEGEARIVSRSASFQRDGTADAAPVPADGLDTGDVGQAA